MNVPYATYAQDIQNTSNGATPLSVVLDSTQKNSREQLDAEFEPVSFTFVDVHKLQILYVQREIQEKPNKIAAFF